MRTLLHLDSSPLYKTSVTRELSGAFVEQWKASNRNGYVIERDLTTSLIPPIDQEWIAAAYAPKGERTQKQIEALTLSETLVAELEEATDYVVGVPMHNFSVPSVLKLWIDQIARVGRTFVFQDGRPEGLLIGKRATFVIATGQSYDQPSGMAPLDFVEPYLRTIFSFLGVTNAAVITVSGAGALNRGQDRTAFLKQYLKAVTTEAQTAEQFRH